MPAIITSNTYWMNCRPFCISCQRLFLSWHAPDMFACFNVHYSDCTWNDDTVHSLAKTPTKPSSKHLKVQQQSPSAGCQSGWLKDHMLILQIYMKSPWALSWLSSVFRNDDTRVVPGKKRLNMFVVLRADDVNRRVVRCDAWSLNTLSRICGIILTSPVNMFNQSIWKQDVRCRTSSRPYSSLSYFYYILVFNKIRRNSI